MIRLVTFLERGDVSLFLRRDLLLVGSASCSAAQRLRRVAGIHRLVHVRAKGISDPPMGHRAPGVEMRRRAEGANGFLVIEAKEQPQALIKVTLRFGRIRVVTGWWRSPRPSSSGPGSSSEAAEAKATAAVIANMKALIFMSLSQFVDWIP